MSRYVQLAVLLMATAFTGCREESPSSDTILFGSDIDLASPEFQPTPRPFSDVTVCGNGTISEAEYAAIQKAVSDYHSTCVPTLEPPAREPDMYYSPAILQVRVEDQMHVTVHTGFYGVLLGAGNIIDLMKMGDNWIVVNVEVWAK